MWFIDFKLSNFFNKRNKVKLIAFFLDKSHLSVYNWYVDKYEVERRTPVLAWLIYSVDRQKVTFEKMLFKGCSTYPFLFDISGGEIINKQKRNNEELVNENIRFKELLVITASGEKLGVLSRNEALAQASNRGLDLVVVSQDGNPPVARIMDYSRFRFEQQKKLKEMRKNQKTVVVQEIQLSPTIEKHDFETKARKARTILTDKGNKIKISLRFYGRMIVHQDLGKEVIDRFIALLEDCSVVESPAKLDGRTLFAVIGPKNNTNKGAQ